MRDLIIVMLLCLAAAFVVDHVWFGGKYLGVVTREFEMDISSVNRR